MQKMVGKYITLVGTKIPTFRSCVIGAELKRNKIPYIGFFGKLDRPKFYINWRD
jgi:hypothetical protein